MNHSAITTVWIEEGCIACGACPIQAPEIFDIPDGSDTAVIRGIVRVDSATDTNQTARSPLRPRIGDDQREAIEEAAEGCPVEVIRLTRTG